jgi:hypothetical protein
MGAFLRPTEERKAAAGIVPAVEEVSLPEPTPAPEPVEAEVVEAAAEAPEVVDAPAPKTRSRRPPTAKE